MLRTVESIREGQQHGERGQKELSCGPIPQRAVKVGEPITSSPTTPELKQKATPKTSLVDKSLGVGSHLALCPHLAMYPYLRVYGFEVWVCGVWQILKNGHYSTNS